MNIEASLTYAFNRLKRITLLLKIEPTATILGGGASGRDEPPRAARKRR